MKHTFSSAANALPILAAATFLSWPGVVADANELHLELDREVGSISVYRDGTDAALLTQNARPDFRPFLHPIVAPDGRGVLTEYSPAHHKHQTGLYWGFTRVNGRDYFHHPET